MTVKIVRDCKLLAVMKMGGGDGGDFKREGKLEIEKMFVRRNEDNR